LERRSLGSVAIVVGKELERILGQLPAEGFLFPILAKQSECVRASRFRKVANRHGFTEISLHSYRYAWARRAKSFGISTSGNALPGLSRLLDDFGQSSERMITKDD